MNTPVHLAVALVTAHLLGDFVFQSRRMIARKTNVLVLTGHALVVAALSYALAGAWAIWEIFVVILITHAAIDFIKVASKRHGLRAFSLDQGAHLAVIGVLIWRLDLAPVALSWVTRFGNRVTEVLVVTAAVIAASKVSGIIIEKAIRPFQEQLPASVREQGFLAGGGTIGRLERLLILVFVLMGEPGAIGFLIAAKSVLRFGELRDHRKEAEYVIIGTMWSFVCGLVIALGARAVLGAI